MSKEAHCKYPKCNYPCPDLPDCRDAEQPAQQEPVAYLCENAVGHKYFRWKKPSNTYKPIALYTSPQAQQALDKKAENARELGLDYEPAQQEPVPAAMKTVIQAMQQDPDYAWSWHCNIAMAFVDAGGDHYTGNQGAARFMKMLANVEPAHELPSPQPAQQEPVVWMYQDKSTHEVKFQKHMRGFVDHGATYETPLYITPPQRTWVGLTDEDIRQCSRDVVAGGPENSVDRFAYAIEAKLMEKNT